MAPTWVSARPKQAAKAAGPPPQLGAVVGRWVSGARPPALPTRLGTAPSWRLRAWRRRWRACPSQPALAPRPRLVCPQAGPARPTRPRRDHPCRDRHPDARAAPPARPQRRGAAGFRPTPAHRRCRHLLRAERLLAAPPGFAARLPGPDQPPLAAMPPRLRSPRPKPPPSARLSFVAEAPRPPLQACAARQPGPASRVLPVRRPPHRSARPTERRTPHVARAAGRSFLQDARQARQRWRRQMTRHILETRPMRYISRHGGAAIFQPPPAHSAKARPGRTARRIRRSAGSMLRCCLQPSRKRPAESAARQPTRPIHFSFGHGAERRPAQEKA